MLDRAKFSPRYEVRPDRRSETQNNFEFQCAKMRCFSESFRWLIFEENANAFKALDQLEQAPLFVSADITYVNFGIATSQNSRFANRNQFPRWSACFEVRVCAAVNELLAQPRISFSTSTIMRTHVVAASKSFPFAGSSLTTFTEHKFSPNRMCRKFRSFCREEISVT